MFLKNRPKIELLIDKITLLYSYLSEMEEIPEVEVQLLQKYVRELDRELAENTGEKLSGRFDTPRSADRPDKPVSTASDDQPGDEHISGSGHQKNVPTEETPRITDQRAPEKELIADKPSASETEVKTETETGQSGSDDKTSVQQPEEKPDDKISQEQREAGEIKEPSGEKFLLSSEKAGATPAKRPLVKEENDDENEEPSVNTLFDKSKEKVIADKLQGKPVNDLRTEIDLNNKFWFINELFNSEPETYKSAVSLINEQPDYNSAEKVISENYRGKYNWEDKKRVEAKFMDFVKRRFLL